MQEQKGKKNLNALHSMYIGPSFLLVEHFFFLKVSVFIILYILLHEVSVFQDFLLHFFL